MVYPNMHPSDLPVLIKIKILKYLWKPRMKSPDHPFFSDRDYTWSSIVTAKEFSLVL